MHIILVRFHYVIKYHVRKTMVKLIESSKVRVPCNFNTTSVHCNPHKVHTSKMARYKKDWSKREKNENGKQYNEHGEDEHRVLGEKGGRKSGTHPKRG